MYNLLLLPLAKQDISEAAFWYENKQDGLGGKFIAKVERKGGLIQSNPSMYPARYENVRVTVLKGFPFMIHYIVIEDDKTVIISAVLHTSRNSEAWNKST